MSFRSHWEKTYSEKGPHKVGWYQPHLSTSFELLRQTGVDKESHIIDVGGGASTLPDDLLDCGFKHVTVLDLSSTALGIAKSRLGKRAKDVVWIEGDITEVTLDENFYDVWHDRASFHFLITPDDRSKYIDLMLRSLRQGAHILLATFSPEAPPRCNGLDVARYTSDLLKAEFGNQVTLIESRRELHRTPGGVEQPYIYGHFRTVT